MKKRTGDWRDLLSGYKLAFDLNKIRLGLLAVVMVIVVLVLATMVDSWVMARGWTPTPRSLAPDPGAIRAETGILAAKGEAFNAAVDALEADRQQLPGKAAVLSTKADVLRAVLTARTSIQEQQAEALRDYNAADMVLLQWAEAACVIRPITGIAHGAIRRVGVLLNLFNGGLAHLIVSALAYVGLFWVLSGCGGTISRLAALEFGRDDLPTLDEASTSVRRRRRAYFMAPVIPLLVIVGLSLVNAVFGLIGWIPFAGRLFLVPLYLFGLALSVIMLFLLVVGILGFGMMMPAVSVSGKGSFEGWSTAYSYVLWGFSRFIVYAVILAAIGLVATAAAWGLVALLEYCVGQTIDIGMLSRIPWQNYSDPVTGSAFGDAWYAVFQGVIVLFRVFLFLLPLAYAVSYFFSSNTVLFLLMRKHVDNVELDEIYDEELEAPEGPEEPGAAEEPEVEEQAPADEDLTGPAEQALDETPETEEQVEDDELQEPSEEPEPEGPGQEDAQQEGEQAEGERPGQ